jgi:hypothetical protein
LSGKAGARVDLAVIPPGTESATADTAMTLAATHGNRIHAQHIVASVVSAQTPQAP